MVVALLVVLTITAVGLPLVLAIDRDTSGPALLGLAFLYGTGAVYFVLLLLSVFGVRWSLTAGTALLMGIAAAALLRVLRTARKRSPDVRVHWSPVDAATLAVLAVYAWYASVVAGTHWDFWAIWGLKGRVFYEAGGIDWRFLTSRWNVFAHPDYPPLLPLNYVSVALAGGGWNDRWVGILFVAFGAALLLIIRAEAARDVSVHAAAAMALASTVFALSPQIGVAEGPLIAYGGAALLMVRRGLRIDDPIAMRHGAILLGLAGATKNEGMALVVAAVVATVVARRSGRRIAQLWPAAALIAPWLILRTIYSLPTDLAASGAAARLSARLWALPQLAEAMAGALTHRIVWGLLLLSLLIVPIRLLRREVFLLVALAIELGFFTLAYLVTPLDAAWHVASSFGRISTQLGVPFIYVITVGLAQCFSAAEDHRHAEAGS